MAATEAKVRKRWLEAVHEKLQFQKIEGWCKVLKSKSNHKNIFSKWAIAWKTLWITLEDSTILMYSQKLSSATKEGEEYGEHSPIQKIFLNASASCDVADNGKTFRITCSKWMKRGTQHAKLRTFEFTPVVPGPDAHQWKTMVKNVIEKQRLGNFEKGTPPLPILVKNFSGSNASRSEKDAATESALDVIQAIEDMGKAIHSLIQEHGEANVLLGPLDALIQSGETLGASISNAQLLSASASESFVDMLKVSDLDYSSKAWLTEEFTREVPLYFGLTSKHDQEENGPQESEPQLDRVHPLPSRHNEDVQNFQNWNFDVLSIASTEELGMLVVSMFTAVEVKAVYSIPTSVLFKFVAAIREKYLSTNPYHNFYHATDVLQTVFCILTSMGAKEHLHHIDTFCLMIAALAHDVGHPGLNNSYHVNAQTDLAVTYNDQSVLENMHSAILFRTLKDSTQNILGYLDVDTLRKARKRIMNLILSTDMASHFDITKEIDSLLQSPMKGTNDGGSRARRKVLGLPERAVLSQGIMHLADISNPAKPWRVSKAWSDLVLEEFFMQGDREQQLGLPISPNMDRRTTKQEILSLNFIDFIVTPIFIATTNILPAMKKACDILASNRNEWDTMREEALKVSVASGQILPAEAEKDAEKWHRRRLNYDMIFVKNTAEKLSKMDPRSMEPSSPPQAGRSRKVSKAGSTTPNAGQNRRGTMLLLESYLLSTRTPPR